MLYIYSEEARVILFTFSTQVVTDASKFNLNEYVFTLHYENTKGNDQMIELKPMATEEEIVPVLLIILW